MPWTPKYYNYDMDVLEPCTFNNSLWVQTVVGPYINSIICILGFVGNSLVIVTYAFYEKIKSMTDIYLLNVAIADLLFVLALPLIIYNEFSSWSMGPVACKLLRGSYSINLYSGMLLLACISIDRYIAIVQARRSFRLRSLSYMVVVFIACHLPYNVVLLYDTVNMFEQAECEDLDRLQTVLMVMQSIAYLHCCLNPVLYAFVGVKFRNHFRRIFQDLCCRGKKYIAPRRSSRVTSEFNKFAACDLMDGYSENDSFTM
uniref:Chemokine (C-C motif) receptor 6a n=1 Tax=Acanthochromis polyacanthus TaxID=80966 RepID=A0A3Q1GJF4_9TELE